MYTWSSYTSYYLVYMYFNEKHLEMQCNWCDHRRHSSIQLDTWYTYIYMWNFIDTKSLSHNVEYYAPSSTECNIEDLEVVTKTILDYNPDIIPPCYFMPTKALLFKMMKACIGVYRVEDLWIYE